MDIAFVAKQCIDNGWAVVPVVQGEKRAATSWQKRTYTPGDFKATDGIALKCGEPSGWLIDVDCDAPEAVELAAMLLPRTGLIHGRPGKPNSHYWYVSDGLRTVQYTDVAGTGKSGMLIEIRSTGGYTLIPPSKHPSGDVLAWSIQREPLTIAPDALQAAVVWVALGSLLARHWPGGGQRHGMIGPLAGFLCQAGVDPAAVVEIIRAAATVARDPDVPDRVHYAEATVAKFQRGEKVTGGPKLAESIPEEVVAKMRGWLKLADVDALEEMNAKHFIVRIGKDELIGTEDGEEVYFQYRRALELRYANRAVNVGLDSKGKPQIKPLLTAWLESRGRRDYRAVTFAPPPLVCDPRDYNLWKGLAVAPAAGACPRFLEHIYENICAGHGDYYDYLMKLLAFMVQQPGVPGEVAVVLRGEPGTGKGVFVRALLNLFGRHATHLDKVDQLVGHFNAQLSGKVLVFADEAFWAGDKREIGALKRLITEPTNMIERKGIDAILERNCVHLFMATNEEWSIPAMLQERRFFALNVSNKRRQHHAYFAKIQDELAQGGLAAFAHELLAHPVTVADIRNVPRTGELRVQQDQSLSLELKWWQECLWHERLGSLSWDEWRGFVTSNNLYEAYKLWVKDQNGRLLTAIEFSRRLSQYVSTDPRSHARRISGRVERGWALRPLTEARAWFDTQLGTTTEWPDPLSATPGPVTPPMPFEGGR